MKLLDRVRDVGLRRHLSPRTIECYRRWAHEFLLYCADRPRTAAPQPAADDDDPFDIPLMEDPPTAPAVRPGRTWHHPRDLGAADVGEFLTHLARDRQLSASSQNQATNAITFLYRHVLADDLPPDHLGRFAGERSKRPRRVPAKGTFLNIARQDDWRGMGRPAAMGVLHAAISGDV